MFSNLLSKENILLWSFMANLANQRLACSSSTYYIVVNKYMNFSIKGLYASALITWNLTSSFITWIGNFSENRKRDIYIYIWGITYGMNGFNWAMCTTMKILGVGGMAKRLFNSIFKLYQAHCFYLALLLFICYYYCNK